jgi:hypothetical protein
MVAETSSRSGGVPALARRAENAIEKQDAWAAAINSSGLVIPPSSPVRAAQETASGPNAPLPTCSIVPEPVLEIALPAHPCVLVRHRVSSCPS